MPDDLAREFAIQSARLAANTKCHQVVLLDVRNLSPVCDYLILATGTSPRQMRTVAEELGELGEGQKYPPYRHTGEEGETWICIDFIDVVVHLFSGDARMYYDLDGLWGDAPKVEWEETPAK